MFPSPVTPTTPARGGVSTFIAVGWMSQTAHYSQVAGFVGGSGPATGAQQRLQWCVLACRGRPPPSSRPRVPASPRSENQVGGALIKNPPANAGNPGDVGLIPGLGRFPGGGNGHLFQCSCLEDPMDTGV